MKVGVLFGGISAEREISLVSGQEVCRVLAEEGVDAVSIDIVTSDKHKVRELIVKPNIDLAFIALHGEFGEDGQIQEILEELNILYTGSGPKASALAMDKLDSKTVFRANGIPTSDFTVLSSPQDIPRSFRYPLVVKPCNCGSSIGVSIVRNQTGLKSGVELAFSYSDRVILEDYVEGRELTVGVLANRPLAVVEIIPKKGYYDFNTKYSHGAATFIVPAKLESETEKKVKSLALKAHRALGCRHFSRVDMRLTGEHSPFVLEVNSIPGLTSHSLLPLSAGACGIDFNRLILQMVKLALPRHRLGAATR